MHEVVGLTAQNLSYEKIEEGLETTEKDRWEREIMRTYSIVQTQTWGSCLVQKSREVTSGPDIAAEQSTELLMRSETAQPDGWKTA